MRAPPRLKPRALSTRRLRIVPFTSLHLTDRYIGWLNDPFVVRYSDQRHRRHTRATGREYLRSFAGTPHFFWAIVAKRRALGHIGTITAYVDVPNQVADVGILIGERRAWRQGFGLEAWEAVCRYLFQTGGVRKVTAGTVASNTAMVRLMKRSGMVADGRRRGQCLVDGRPVDLIQAALFRESWLKRRG